MKLLQARGGAGEAVDWRHVAQLSDVELPNFARIVGPVVDSQPNPGGFSLLTGSTGQPARLPLRSGSMEDDRIVYAIGMLGGVERKLERLMSMVVWSFVFLAILVVSSCAYGMAS